MECLNLIIFQRDIIPRGSQDSNLHEQCDLPITINELENYFSSVKNYRIGIIYEHKAHTLSSYVMEPHPEGGSKLVRFYNLRRKYSKSCIDMTISDVDYNTNFDITDNFKLDFKTLYHILNEKKSKNNSTGYISNYIFRKFDQFVDEIDYKNIYSLLKAYNFLKINHDIFHPKEVFGTKIDTIKYKLSLETGNLICEHMNVHNNYIAEVTRLISRTRKDIEQMTKPPENFSSLPLELQQKILEHDDICNRRFISKAFVNLGIYNQSRTPIIRKELDEYLSFRENYMIGLVEPDITISGYIVLSAGKTQSKIRLYNVTACNDSIIILNKQTDYILSTKPFELPIKFRLDFRTSYYVLKERKNCQWITNYPKTYILELFDDFLKNIDYEDLYSLVMSYNFLKINCDIFHPETPINNKFICVPCQERQATGKLIPLDIILYQKELNHYILEITKLISQLREDLKMLD